MSLPKVPGRTTPGFAFSMVERALKDCLGRREFGLPHIGEALGFFGSDPPTCVFCGSPQVQRWDHLVPINKGGETVLGNMVPACGRCDDSKRDLEFGEWMRVAVASSPMMRGVSDVDDKIRRIAAYVEAFDYQVIPLEMRLTEEEQEKLATIRAELQQLKNDVDDLISVYRRRTGNR